MHINAPIEYYLFKIGQKICGEILTINIFKVSPTNVAPPSPRMTRKESFSSHDGKVAPAISAIFGLVHTKAQF